MAIPASSASALAYAQTATMPWSMLQSNSISCLFMIDAGQLA
jgi:hypothetical protein